MNSNSCFGFFPFAGTILMKATHFPSSGSPIEHLIGHGAKNARIEAVQDRYKFTSSQSRRVQIITD
jgi:hypothetical protein